MGPINMTSGIYQLFGGLAYCYVDSISAERTAATRSHMLGQSFEISGSDEKIWLDAERDHRRIILSKLSKMEKQEALEVTKREVVRILKARNGGLHN